MKRDMDLVRLILLELERRGRVPGGSDELVIEGYDDPRIIRYHMELLTDTNLVVAVWQTSKATHDSYISYVRLSWQGHEFIETVRDPKRWKQVMDASAKAGGITFEVVFKTALELLTKAALTYVGLS